MQVITANDLKTGVVVYLTAAGDWTPAIEEARTVADEAEGQARLARAQRAATAKRVVEPYLIDVIREGGVLRPLRLREHIRARGPTVPSDFSQVSDKRA